MDQDIKRRFPTVLDIGSGPGFISKHLDPEITQKLIMTDSARRSSCPDPGRGLSLSSSLCPSETMLYRDVDLESEGELSRLERRLHS